MWMRKLQYCDTRASCCQWFAVSMFILMFFMSSLALYAVRYCSSHRCALVNLPPSSTHNVTITPTIGFHMDWTHILVFCSYGLVLAVVAVFRGIKAIYWFLLPLVGTISFQLSRSVWTLLFDYHSYIQDQLDESWERASMDFRAQLQNRWQCQGFADPLDRPALPTTQTNPVPCLNKLADTFGPAIHVWGLALWMIKLIQIIGLVACYALYIRMEHHDQQEEELAEENAPSEKKAPPLSEV